MDALDAILTRRSVGRLSGPAPTPGALHRILEAAAAAPDHGGLRPWRFIVLAGAGKEGFGQVLAEALLARCREAGTAPTPAEVDRERAKLDRAPLVVVVAGVHRPSDRIPRPEQLASAAAAAENALVAATALGYGSMWRTGDAAYDPRVKAALGLGPDDAIVGFLYLGTRPEGSRPLPPHRPDLAGVVAEWTPEAEAGGAP